MDPRFLLTFKTRANFEKKLADGTVSPLKHLVLIQDQKRIWFRGQFYNGAQLENAYTGCEVDQTDPDNIKVTFTNQVWDEETSSYKEDSKVITLVPATEEVAGLMSAEDKKLLGTINDGLEKEIKDRQEADSSLQELITSNSEITAAALAKTNAEVDSLKTYAKSNISDIKQDIDDIQDSIKDIDTLQTNVKTLQTNVKTLQSDEDVIALSLNDLNTRINDEVSARTTADNDLQTQIDNLKSSSSGDVSSLTSKIDQEISDRKAADSNLSTQISDTATSFSEAITSLKITKVDASDSTIAASYKLIDKDNAQHGVVIDIPKDQSIKDIEMSTLDATLDSDGMIVDGAGTTALCISYILADGSYKIAHLDYQKFLEETEFSQGLEVVNHKIQVKLDTTSESFLTISEDGIKLSGVQDAIDVEKTRAEAAENTLKELINSNNTTVTDSIAEEKAAREKADSELTTKITAEVATLNQTISDNELTVSTALNTLNTNLTNEITRAEAAEKTNTDAITDEVTRAKAAEATNASNVTTEVARAKAAETTLQTNIDKKQDKLTFDSSPVDGSVNPVTSGGVYTALSSKQNTLTWDNTPTANSTNAVNSGAVQAAIATETTRAQGAESTLNSAITQETSNREAAITAVNTSITNLTTTVTNLSDTIGKTSSKDATITDSLTTIATVNGTDIKAQIGTIPKIWQGTKAEYEAITTKDATTLYLINEESGES